MLFTTTDLARGAGFKSRSNWVNECYRYGLPFSDGVRVGNQRRYGAVDLAKSLLMGRLRMFGVPTSKQAELLKLIDEHALAEAIDHHQAGEIETVIIGVPSWDQLEDFTGIFTSRQAAVAALEEADFILIEIGDYIDAHIRGII